MPDAPLTPDKRKLADTNDFVRNPPAPYVELGLASSFSFLRGASDPIDLVTAAHALGYDSLGIADRNTMAGVVRLHSEAKTAKVTPVIGCRLDLTDGPSLYAYPRTRGAYGDICCLLSLGKVWDSDGKWQAKDVCDISLADVRRELTRDLFLIAIPGEDLDAFEDSLPSLAAHPLVGHIAAVRRYRDDDRARINRLRGLAQRHGLKLVATNDVHYHCPSRRPLQDVMTCIRKKVMVTQAGNLLAQNGERHLKSPEEMQRLFADWPDAIAETRRIADACAFSLDELRYEYPQESVPGGKTPDAHLADLAWAGAAEPLS